MQSYYLLDDSTLSKNGAEKFSTPEIPLKKNPKKHDFMIGFDLFSLKRKSPMRPLYSDILRLRAMGVKSGYFCMRRHKPPDVRS